MRVTNKFGSAVMESWPMERAPHGSGPLSGEEEPDLPAWCNKVERVDWLWSAPSEISKHLMDIEVGGGDS